MLGGIALKVVLPCVIDGLNHFLNAHNLELPPGQVITVYRVEVKGTLYYSRQYQRTKKRNSYTVMYYDLNRFKRFALIEYFVFVHNRVIAVLTPLSPLDVTCEDHFYLSTTVIDKVAYLHPVTVEDFYCFCFVEDIICKCLFEDFGYIKYVVQFPSSLTFD